MSSEIQQPNSPQSRVNDAYAASMDAREVYYRVEHSQTDDGNLHRAHRELQSTTMAYFEVLRSYLRTADSVQKYWNGKPVTNGDVDPSQGIAYLYSDRTQNVLGADDLPDGWPETVKLDDGLFIDTVLNRADGGGLWVAIRQDVCGLKHLDTGFETRRESTKQTHGLMGVRTTTHEVPDQYAPPILYRAARALDRAANELDLLAQYSDDTRPFEDWGEGYNPEDNNGVSR